jgi:hypothetical protein
MRRTSYLVNNFAILMLLLASACNMPGRASRGTPTPDVTQAYQTVEARLTEAASKTPAASPTSDPTDTPGNEATSTSSTPLATTAPPPTTAPTSAVKLCDQADAGSPIDVTIPDDTQMSPGQTFTKVWRLRNVGTCSWSKNYVIAVFSGEGMSAPNSVPMPKAIDPGQTVDISVDLVAPTTAGTYQGNWKLKNASGSWFGIGPNGGSPFWVRIVVKGGTAAPPSATYTIGFGTAYPPPTTPENPAVQVSGSNTLVAGDGINLDTNQLNSGGIDVGLVPNAQGRLLLTTVGNAGMLGFGLSAPTYTQCKSAGVGSASVTMRNIPNGFYICYKTDQGLFGWLRVVTFNDNTGTLNLQMNTWAMP